MYFNHACIFSFFFFFFFFEKKVVVTQEAQTTMAVAVAVAYSRLRLVSLQLDSRNAYFKNKISVLVNVISIDLMIK